MSTDSATDMPADTVAPAKMIAEDRVRGAWTDTALTVLFAGTAVLFVSFLAVVTGLV